MNHRPYEDWLFNDDDLSPEEQRELALHLRHCDACKTLSNSWDEVEGLFSAAKLIEPMPGFDRRWKERLLLRKQANHHRQTSLILFFLSSAATILAVPLVLQLALMALSPEDLLFDAIRQAVHWLAWFEFLWGFITGLLGSVARTVPVGWWLIGLLGICTLIGLWLISIGRFVQAPIKERRF